MPLVKSTSRVMREGAVIHLTGTWVRDGETGNVVPQVNGVFTCTTTKADGSAPQIMTTGVDGVPAIVDVLTTQERTQLAALADKVFAALRDQYGLSEA